ncbi:hypothetical protein LC087_09715 [Bacillus carboniphilus]|uniref:Uncharacterized protein n=1 Tax=Bacillus carboniphilus TaxID=86663 RepID=A0ABY9JS39_9BACI|nr:hypothetical protein [Bacillus carboniphilus]WLR41220.1 hypothetical protein LC087_09715 [Bacillus carboniphilus]
MLINNRIEPNEEVMQVVNPSEAFVIGELLEEEGSQPLKLPSFILCSNTSI